MRHTSLVVFLCLVCVLSGNGSLFAQSNFVNGFYVTSGNDTVRGLIDDRSDKENFELCIFKTSADAGVRMLDPGDINGFGFGNVVYVKQQFKEKNGKDLVGFFKVLVDGKLSLLNFDTRYFVITKQREMYEVTRSRADATGTIKDNFQGLGNLKLLMNDCPVTNEAYLRRQYADANLKNIFVTYNECVNSPVVVLKDTRAKTKIEAGIQVLPSLVRMNDGYPMGLVTMSNNKTIAAGAFLSVLSPRFISNVELLLEANYYQYNGYGFFHYRDQNVETNNDIFVKYKALQIPVFLRIGQRFFIDVGIQNHITFKQDNTWREETITTSTVTTQFIKVEGGHLWTTGLLIGAGAKFDVGSFPLRVFARYSRNGNPFFSSRPGYQATSIGVSFQLTKN